MLAWGAVAGFWLGLALIPIAIFYFLRMRFRRQPISSIYLWLRLRQEAPQGSRWRWWSILLLCLQLFVALAATLALAQPAWMKRFQDRPGVVYLLDVSASMAAKSDGRTRLDEAYAALSRDLQTLARTARGTPAAVFLCADDAVPLLTPTANYPRLLKAARKARPGGAGFVEAAVADAIQIWQAGQARPWKICLITDGGLDLGGRRLGSMLGGFRLIQVGAPCPDLGLAGLRLASPGRAEFRLINNTGAAKPCRVRLTLNGRPLAGASLTAPPGISAASLAVGGGALPPGIYSAALTGAADGFPADDRTYLAMNSLQPRKVLLVGPGNPFLRAAILSQPYLQLHEAPDFQSKAAAGTWDLIIAEGVAVPAGLKANLLLFGRTPPDAPVRLGGQAAGILTTVHETHVLMRFVDWQEAQVNRGQAVRVSEGGQVLAAAGGKPILAAWEDEGRRGAVWGTTLLSTNLGLSGAFPVFFRNFLGWCFPQATNPLAFTLTVGKESVLAAGPSWRVREKGLVDAAHEGAMVRVRPLALGASHWSEGGSRGVLAANLPASELDLELKPIILGADNAPAASGYASRRTPLAKGLLFLVLVALCLEWWFWRGSYPPARGEAL